MSSPLFNRIRRGTRRRYIEDYQFAAGLKTKLHEELGDSATTEIALEGLRAWYLACLYADGALIAMPSKAVDVAWHEMILRTREYTEFCERAFGGYLHHSPDSTMDIPSAAIMPATLRIVDQHDLPMVLFTADTDAGLNDGHEWSSTDLRRLRDAYAVRPSRNKRKRHAYAGGSSSGYYGGGSCGGFVGDSGGGGGGGDGGGGGGCGGGGCGGGG